MIKIIKQLLTYAFLISAGISNGFVLIILAGYTYQGRIKKEHATLT